MRGEENKEMWDGCEMGVEHTPSSTLQSTRQKKKNIKDGF
jgi:hypothetical protein